MNQKQIFLLEGIRYCANSISISYDTLSTELDLVSSHHGTEFSFDLIFKEAWSQIDTTYRLTNLLKAIYKTDSRFIEKDDFKFLAKTKPFRNSFQHLDERIDGILLKLNQPVWGTLSWLKIIDKSSVNSYILSAGHPRKDFKSRAINPMGLTVTPPIDKITIEAVQRDENDPVIRIELSELYKRTKNLIGKLEESLEEKLSPHLTNGILPQDMLMGFIIEVKNEA